MKTREGAISLRCFFSRCSLFCCRCFLRSCFDSSLLYRSFFYGSDLFRGYLYWSLFSCRSLSRCFFRSWCCSRSCLSDYFLNRSRLLREDVDLLALEYALRDEKVHEARRNLSTLSHPVLDALWLERYGLGLRVIRADEVDILACLRAGRLLEHEHAKGRVVLSANALETDHQHSEAKSTRRGLKSQKATREGRWDKDQYMGVRSRRLCVSTR